MIYKFDDIIYYQIKFYYDNYHNILDFLQFSESYNNFNEDTNIFKHTREILSNGIEKNNVESIIETLSKTKEVYLTTSTISPSKYQFHPFVNIHIHWNYLPIENNLTGDGISTVFAWPNDVYNYTNKIAFNKSIKSILSVRRKTHFRDILFSKITSDTNCIFRYHEYISKFNKKVEYYSKTENTPPTWQELSEEHSKSIFAFVIETDNGDNPYINSQITEKTLTAFLNGNIPIVLGQKNFVRELKDIGLYVWNGEFGFEDADSSNSYEYRITKFVNCYNNIKKISLEDSIKIWYNNIDKIQKNYDIISNLVTKRWKPIPNNLI